MCALWKSWGVYLYVTNCLKWVGVCIIHSFKTQQFTYLKPNLHYKLYPMNIINPAIFSCMPWCPFNCHGALSRLDYAARGTKGISRRSVHARLVSCLMILATLECIRQLTSLACTDRLLIPLEHLSPWSNLYIGGLAKKKSYSHLCVTRPSGQRW